MRVIEHSARKVAAFFRKTLMAGIILFAVLLVLSLFLMFYPSSLSDHVYDNEESVRLLLLLMDISMWTVIASFVTLALSTIVLLFCWFTKSSNT